MIAQGSQVSVHYTLRVDGEVVDSSLEGDPIAFVCGAGEMIPGFEEALLGLKAGDQKNFTVPTEKAYGQNDPEAIQKVPRNFFDDESFLNVGEMIEGEVEGHAFQALITEVTDDQVTLDLNHPLAGKNLDFEVEVVSVA